MSSTRRIVLAGGNGQIGGLLAQHFNHQGHEVIVLARKELTSPWQTLLWDGSTLGPWVAALERADVLINLAGRSVNCRYTEANRRAMKDSRVQTTRLLGSAVGKTAHPPRLWLNASTATIYRHALDRPMDEDTGEFGGQETDAPISWHFSIAVATSWEDAFFSSATPRTRKVAMRSAMVMTANRGGIFAELLGLVRLGLGGTAGSGKQFVSWIHGEDFLASVDYLIQHEEIRGPVNLASPNPLPNREFMRAIRNAWGAPLGLPAAKWMLELGAMVLRTETELILKSRRVVPDRLLQSGFRFRFPTWPESAEDLVRSWREILPVGCEQPRQTIS